MSNESHTQCKLQKGNSVQTTWLPSKFAVKGKYIKLRRRGAKKIMDDGLHETQDPNDFNHTEWDDGWQVVEIFTTMESSYVNERSRDHRHLPSLERQRKKR